MCRAGLIKLHQIAAWLLAKCLCVEEELIIEADMVDPLI